MTNAPSDDVLDYLSDEEVDISASKMPTLTIPLNTAV
ncbi:hypothetical protein TeGR_g4344, partial [Tetraparma gracilis]